MDQSATGQTIYLEPGEVMANNDLFVRDLGWRSVRKWCGYCELTSRVRVHLPELEIGYSFLGEIGFHPGPRRAMPVRLKLSFRCVVSPHLGQCTPSYSASNAEGESVRSFP